MKKLVFIIFLMCTVLIKPLKQKQNNMFEGLITFSDKHPCCGTLPSRVLFYMGR
jgi:hypothetical protein